MPTNTADQQIPLPVDADTADNPTAFTNYTGVVENRLVRRYTNDADRTARDTSPAAGEITYNGTTMDWTDSVPRYREITPLFSRLTSDSAPVNNSTTFANTGISFPVRANAVYDFQNRLLCSSATGPDIKFQWTFPAGLTMNYMALGIAVAGSALTFQNAIQTTVPAFEGSGSDFTVLFQGLVIVGGTAGTLLLQFTQNSAVASNTLIRAQSYGTLIRVA